MPSRAQSREPFRLDERNHVEKPLLDRLAGLDWEVIGLTDMKQIPVATCRESFAEVMMLRVLRERLKVINPWLEDDQVDEVVKQPFGKKRVTPLLEFVASMQPAQ